MADSVVKLSEIRAKFPMYADLSDEQLLIGVRKQFYPDIPMAKFAGMVDFDTQRQALQRDAAEASGPFLSGVGQAMTNLARGVGQAFGAVSREDVKDSRALDAGLSSTTGGKVGNVVGNVAGMLPAALIPGANAYAGAAGIGALTGALQPSESTGETLTNTAIGAAAGPAGIMLGRGVGATWNAGKALVEPFTKAGQEKVAARTLQQFASNPQKAAAALKGGGEIVPGSVPTMAQASGDSGLAQLERALASLPTTGKRLADQMAEQRAARLAAVQKVAGTDSYYDAIKAGIKTFAKEDYDKAIAAGFDPKALAMYKGQLDALLSRPSIKAAQSTARELAEEAGDDLTSLGSVKGLDYLVKALDNNISAATGAGSSIGKAKLDALLSTKRELQDLIGKVAPAYAEARGNFAQMVKQRNAMDVARDVLSRMQSPLGRYGASTNELRHEYARALEGATASVKKATGMDMPLAKVMPQADIDALEAVAKDMARATTAENMGRAVGSNTAQNLAAQNLLRRTIGPIGMPEKWAESNVLQGLLAPYTGIAKLGGAEAAVQERLARAAMDPRDAASLLEQALKDPKKLQEVLRYMPSLALGYAQQQ